LPAKRRPKIGNSVQINQNIFQKQLTFPILLLVEAPKNLLPSLPSVSAAPTLKRSQKLQNVMAGISEKTE